MIRRTLATLVATVLLVGPSGGPLASASTVGCGASSAEMERLGVELVNRTRTARGLDPVLAMDGLADVARSWSGRMASSQTLRHNPDHTAQYPAGADAWAENVAYRLPASGLTSVEDLHDQFVASSGHLGNILDPGWTHVGIGYACVATASGVAIYTTQNFASYPSGPGGFYDTAGDTHAASIATVAAAGIANGYADGTYRPHRAVTRGQMASFLARALDLPSAPRAAFSDTGGHVHEAAIAALVAAGTTSGYPDGTFRPDRPVTRGQMSTFLTRALDLPTVSAASGTTFGDSEGSIHATAIVAISAAGIAGGYPDGTFHPEDAVSRGQMATFLVRGVGL